MQKFLFIILVIIFYVFDEQKMKTEMPQAVNNFNKDNVISNDITKENNQNETGNNWIYTKSFNKGTSKSYVFASTRAKKLLHFMYPYSGGSVATFTVRKTNKKVDVFLSISKGQITSKTVKIKFDQNQPKQYSISFATEASSNIIFLHSEADIINKLKSSKIMMIELEFINKDIRQINFDVEGFKWN